MDRLFTAPLQIELLERQASDAYRISEYATAESLYAEAARLAEQGADWPTRVRINYRLAGCRGMQDKAADAIVTYTWLLTLAGDPEVALALANSSALAYLFRAYVQFAISGFDLGLPIARLHKVLDEGERFLAEVAHPEWAHGLRMVRGQLLREQGQLSRARQELEAALSLIRRDTSAVIGFTPSGHINSLAEVLIDLGDIDTAARLFQESLEMQGSPVDRGISASGLSDIAQLRGDWSAAEHWAREGLAMAAHVQSPTTQIKIRRSLLPALLERGKVTEAVSQGAVLWAWGRRLEADYHIAWHLCRVRLACARQAVGLATNPDSELPVQTEPLLPCLQKRAVRYLRAAEHWLVRAQTLARRLDEQCEVETNSKKLQALADKLDALRAWLSTTE